jgi:hypothetical protein
MNIEKINQEFEKLLKTGPEGFKLRKKIGMSAKLAATYRDYLKKEQAISMELKLQWLQKAGIFVQSETYSEADVKQIIKIALAIDKANSSIADAGYVLQKWKTLQKSMA